MRAQRRRWRPTTDDELQSTYRSMVGLEPQVLSTVYAGCYAPGTNGSRLPSARVLPPRASHDGPEGPRHRDAQGRAALLPRGSVPAEHSGPVLLDAPRRRPLPVQSAGRVHRVVARGATWTRPRAARPPVPLGFPSRMRRRNERRVAAGPVLALARRRCARVALAVRRRPRRPTARRGGAAKDAIKKASADYLATNYASAAARLQKALRACGTKQVRARDPGDAAARPRDDAVPHRGRRGREEDVGRGGCRSRPTSTLNPDYETPDLKAAFEEARGGTAPARWASSPPATSRTPRRASRRSTRRCRSTSSTRALGGWCASS